MGLGGLRPPSFRFFPTITKSLQRVYAPKTFSQAFIITYHLLICTTVICNKQFTSIIVLHWSKKTVYDSNILLDLDILKK